jgi:putative thioredoxin
MGQVTAVTAETFAAEVLDRSRDIPVVVDFWAAWCGPCRMIAPILEKLAGELGGRVAFAKLDTDAEPAIAGRYGIRALPTLKIFSAGEVAGEVTGALPEPALRDFIDRHAPAPADRLAAEAAAATDPDAARELWQRALGEDPGHAGARLGLARLALAGGDATAALAELDLIDPRSPLVLEAAELRPAAELVAEAAALDPEAGGPEGIYARGVRAFAAGDHAAALEAFLELVTTDRGFRDDAGRRAMLTVFALRGDADPLVRDYRRRLMIVS